MMEHFTFIEADRDLATALAGYYDLNLVMVSILISVLSSYTAFLISERMRSTLVRSHYIAWLTVGALTLGGGVWAMHFIGMVAYKLPVASNYDVSITFISVIPSVLASLVVLISSGNLTISHKKLLGLSIAMGGGIGMMHYIGMSAMRMEGVMRYDPILFTLSIFVAIFLAGIALKLKWWADKYVDANVILSGHLLLASIVMGSAIAAMHYTGMAAMYIFPGPEFLIHVDALSVDTLLQSTASVVLLIVITLVVAIVVSRRFDLYQRLQDSETRQSTIFRNMIDGVIIIDEYGVIETVNPAGLALFGYEEDEILGKNIKMLMPEPYQSEHDEYLDNYKRTGIKKIIGIGRDVKGLRKDGMTFPLELSVNEMLLNGKGFYIGTLRDISDRKRAEVELNKYSVGLEAMVEERTASMKTAVEEAEKANLAKSEFLSQMSHELRTPMNAILGFAQMMELDIDDLNETQCENVNEILTAGRHLLGLINEVLDLARIESGKLEISMEVVLLSDVLAQSIMLVTSQADMRNITLINTLSEEGYTIYADYTRLKQVLINLLTNAVKYNREDGAILLDGGITDEGVLRINVKDTGCGLKEEEIDKLFSPFERLNAVENVEGTGIGLTITKHLIELMGGHIGVESVVDHGSNFWIEIALFNNQKVE